MATKTPWQKSSLPNHLNDLAVGKVAKIAQLLETTVQRVQEACDLIRTLDPKPGLQYSPIDEVKYIIPDAIVEKVEGAICGDSE